MKNYVVFVNDHSGSMGILAEAARRDYNETTGSLKKISIEENQDTIVSVIEVSGSKGSDNRVTVLNSSISVLKPIERYRTGGGTPMFSGVEQAIKICESVPDFDDENVSFLIYTTTDGEETEKRHFGPTLGKMIKERQASDRWTFAFRVPRGAASDLARLGIPEGNIMEWDQTARGMAQAQASSQEAFRGFYAARSAGQRSSGTFFANLANVSSADVKAVMEDISTRVQLFPVSASDHEMQIRDFVEIRCLNGLPMKKGAAFYQLTKSEDKVQASKKIIIRDKSSGSIYYGDAARQMLGLPSYSDVRLKPADLGNFDVFIQSTSVNRKVQSGSQILYWAEVGSQYKEGPSSRA